VGQTALSAAKTLLKIAIGSRLRRYLQDQNQMSLCLVQTERKDVHKFLPPIIQPVWSVKSALPQHILKIKSMS
jgi:hypothetical protein